MQKMEIYARFQYKQDERVFIENLERSKIMNISIHHPNPVYLRSSVVK